MRHARFAALLVPLALALAACGSGSTQSPAPASTGPSAAPSAAASAAAGNAVSIANFAFAPATITVSAGTTVTWTNNDSTGHTVTADDGSFKSDTLAKGATFSQTFTSPGTYTYHCAIHASMKGTVIVN